MAGAGRKGLVRGAAFLLALAATLALLEATAQLVWRWNYHSWFSDHHRDIHFYRGLFQPHPYLVVAPKPRVSVSKKKTGREISISHNSLGFRGKETTFSPDPHKIRIAVLGGSSTYCISVSDNRTWPYFLEEELGSPYEVINLGVPGYSTAEHLIQLALLVPEFKPQVCIFYIGWNDVRNVHIENLKSDYSDFHGKTQYSNLKLDSLRFGNRSAFLYFIKNMLEQIFTYKEPINIKPGKSAYSDIPDQRALEIYARNIKSMVALCKTWNIIPVFIPQILNKEKLSNDRQNDWAPFLKNYQLKNMIEYYNQKMIEIVNQEEGIVIQRILEVKFLNDDFLDEGHFNEQGNLKFAQTVAQFLRDKIFSTRGATTSD